MPKYYFDFHDGVDLRDDHGKDCPDLELAKQHARQILPDIAADELPKLKENEKSFRVTVRDDGDTVVYIAHLDFRGVIREPVIATDFTPFALVADDDVLIRMDAVNILEDAGFRVYEACNVGEAIEILEVSWESVQLVFTDVQMPPGPQNGFDLARRVSKSWPHIGILVSSGEIKPRPGEMPEGAIFISKPFSSDVVYDRLQELLPDGQQPEQLKVAARRGN
jgi:CheY-like chemotaxis protein